MRLAQDDFRGALDDLKEFGGCAIRAAAALLPQGNGIFGDAEGGGEICLREAEAFAQGFDAAWCAGFAVWGGEDDDAAGLREGEAEFGACFEGHFRADGELASDVLRGIAVAAIAAEIRQGADEALILIAPANDARVARGKGFDFCHIDGVGFYGIFFHGVGDGLRFMLAGEVSGLSTFLFSFCDLLLDVFFLVDLGIVAVVTAQFCLHVCVRIDEQAVRALSAAGGEVETVPAEVGDELSNLPWHGFILSQCDNKSSFFFEKIAKKFVEV